MESSFSNNMASDAGTRWLRSMGLPILAAIVLMLVGCRAMDTRDHDGSRYNNEQQRFYMPEKNAKIGVFSHAYRWKSGDLEGFCSAEYQRKEGLKGDKQGGRGAVAEPVAVDNIQLNNLVLFDTDSSDISAEGISALDQLIARINSYSDVIRLELEGHSDGGSTVAYNNALADRRSSAVKKYVAERIDSSIRIRRFNSGELKPVATNSTILGRKANRRVEARIVAKKVMPNTGNSTLCFPVPKHMSTTSRLLLTDGNRQLMPTSTWELERFRGELPLSVGDQLKITVAGDEVYNGIYEVNLGGAISFPLIGNLQVHGLTVPALRTALADTLVEKKIIRAGAIAVDTSVQQWAPVEVFVRGAVFNPGRVIINAHKADEKAYINTRSGGDYATQRLMSIALQFAGGVRPDADIGVIQIIRDGKTIVADVTGIFTGELTQDVPLVSGDEVIVPSTGYFQGAMVRPSPITPPGIKVFQSNPTTPIYNNASAAIGKNSSSLPYGTRFLRGLVAANCVGGAQHTNASRRGVLISTNPITGATEVIERSVQQLISDPDRDDINPFLLPNDGIACYDSDVTNLREVALSLTEILSPISALRGLLSGN